MTYQMIFFLDLEMGLWPLLTQQPIFAPSKAFGTGSSKRGMEEAQMACGLSRKRSAFRNIDNHKNKSIEDFFFLIVHFLFGTCREQNKTLSKKEPTALTMLYRSFVHKKT